MWRPDLDAVRRTGAFLERDKASGRIVVEAKGKEKRGNGTAGATVVAQVTPAGGSTSVEVTTDLAVTGKPAQFGRGVIQEVSDKLLGQFVDAFIAKMAPDAASDAVVGERPVAETVEETVAGQGAAHAKRLSRRARRLPLSRGRRICRWQPRWKRKASRQLRRRPHRQRHQSPQS